MLQNLEVLNGELTPKYDVNNDTYTVQVTSEVTSLDLKYDLPETSLVNVYGNENFLAGKNYVTIEVIDSNEKVNTLNLIVMKEEVKTTSAFPIEVSPVEVRKELPGYVAPLIAMICFLLILLSFGLIFRQKKIDKKK